MKKTNIKTKIIAGILSAVTLFSVGAVAVISASAVKGIFAFEHRG